MDPLSADTISSCRTFSAMLRQGHAVDRSTLARAIDTLCDAHEARVARTCRTCAYDRDCSVQDRLSLQRASDEALDDDFCSLHTPRIPAR